MEAETKKRKLSLAQALFDLGVVVTMYILPPCKKCKLEWAHIPVAFELWLTIVYYVNLYTRKQLIVHLGR